MIPQWKYAGNKIKHIIRNLPKHKWFRFTFDVKKSDREYIDKLEIKEVK